VVHISTGDMLRHQVKGACLRRTSGGGWVSACAETLGTGGTRLGLEAKEYMDKAGAAPRRAARTREEGRRR
jgi:hypothetical protein